MLNWKHRQDVFECIDNFIGTVIHAAGRYNIGETTIYTWISEGSVVHKKNSTRNGTNNRKIERYHLDYLLYYLDNIDCQLYACEMSDLLWKEFAEIYSKDLIRHTLHLEAYTNKIITGIAAEQNNVLRNLWQQWVIIIIIIITIIIIIISISSRILGLGR